VLSRCADRRQPFSSYGSRACEGIGAFLVGCSAAGAGQRCVCLGKVALPTRPWAGQNGVLAKLQRDRHALARQVQALLAKVHVLVKAHVLVKGARGYCTR
jgi:hypothetical protein